MNYELLHAFQQRNAHLNITNNGSSYGRSALNVSAVNRSALRLPIGAKWNDNGSRFRMDSPNSIIYMGEEVTINFEP